jgi:hypothetical protein
MSFTSAYADAARPVELAAERDGKFVAAAE